ncbi:hypothetical protein FACS1894191_1190 [Clostridia bacterium]|nr:hypothetical protein FACS1894191_1190 [Clostridia bacterium]
MQKLRKTPRRIDYLGEANPLTGILFCADCGAKLHNNRNAHATQHRKKPVDSYRCSTFLHSNRRFENRCTCHYISTDSVRQIILDVLRKTAGYVQSHEAEFVEKVREASAIKQGESAKAYRWPSWRARRETMVLPIKPQTQPQSLIHI